LPINSQHFHPFIDKKIGLSNKKRPGRFTGKTGRMQPGPIKGLFHVYEKVHRGTGRGSRGKGENDPDDVSFYEPGISPPDQGFERLHDLPGKGQFVRTDGLAGHDHQPKTQEYRVLEVHVLSSCKFDKG
jgi:hypothetical protein